MTDFLIVAADYLAAYGATWLALQYLRDLSQRRAVLHLPLSKPTSKDKTA